ncbi:sensor domain-containing diguanylate cyclase/phosphohydrolase [Romboutsia faecis]|uniref:sensor domain-containing diguanylate cyclase/phosphohydrolase n=1 Tax=Romboutsia faecis TaxID=2764597 RepID=UPI00295F0F2D|nr:HD domain-containing phosphohydrolase [Romboutsia faecis]
MYKLFLENIPFPVWIESVDSKIIFLNKSYEKNFNIKLSDVVGKTNKEVFQASVSEEYDRQIKQCISDRKIQRSESMVNGSYMECHMFPIMGKEGYIKAIAGILVDTNDRKEREIEVNNQKDILRTIIDAVPESIFYKDKDSKFIGYNKAFEEFYNKRGITDIIGKTDLDIYDDTDVAKVFIEQDLEVIYSKKTKYFECTLKNDAGKEVVEENLKIPVINNDGNAWGVVGLSRNITDRKKIEDKLRFLSEIDMLTGLYNRYSFEEKMKELNNEKYHPLGIIMGDVNGLKFINDTFGHLEGDILLKEIAKVLKDSCSEKGYVFRWGGDEFMILVPKCDESNCEEIIKKIINNCNKSNYDYMQLSVALGETVRYTPDDDIYDYIKKVENKLYRQKLLQGKSVKSSILESYRRLLKDKNTDTNRHTIRVVKYATDIGKKMNLKISDLDELILSAELHDIGKIGIPEEILLKPSNLTDEEFEIMKSHVDKGYRIVNSLGGLGSVAKNVLTHHERWDGSGYPLGLKQEEIPLLSRIIAVADSYDAMVHERVYKKAMRKEDAIKELRRCSGTQFDPEIVDIFIKSIE